MKFIISIVLLYFQLFNGIICEDTSSPSATVKKTPIIKPEKCCKRKVVNGHYYDLVDDENLAVPGNCSSSCIYQLAHKPGSRFCFSPGKEESECLPGDQIHIPILQNLTENDNIQDELNDINDALNNMENKLRSGSTHGCKPLKDLPKKQGRNYICAYFWNGKNLGAGGKGVTGCQGSTGTLLNHQRQAIQQGRYIPMGTIAVMPGCSLYMYFGNSGYEGQVKVLPSGYVYDNTMGPKGGNYPPGPNGYICECEQDTISCTPSDGYDTLVTCDNRLGTVEATCTYQLTTGTTHSSSLTKEQSISVSVKIEEELTLEGIFKAGVSDQFSTGFKWTEATTETFTETKTITVTDKAPPRKVLIIQQAVGHCAGRKVKTDMIKTRIQETL